MGGSRPAVTKLDGLTGLRFFAALMVVGYHLLGQANLAQGGDSRRLPFQYAFAGGFGGVSFFFVLSGFVLTWSHQPRDRVRSFARRRFARIYPTHALWWVLGFVIFQQPLRENWRAVIAGLLLVQTWFPQHGFAIKGNPVAWSLACEAFFYACFPVLLRVSVRWTPAARRVALGLLLLVPWQAAAITYLQHHIGASYTAGYLPPLRMAEFWVGIQLACMLRRDELPQIPLAVGVMAGLVGYALGDALSLHAHLAVWNEASVPSLFYSVLICAVAQANLRGRTGLLGSSPAVALGRDSFALYMVHVPVMQVLRTLHPISLTDLRVEYGAAVVFTVVSLAVATVQFRLVEAPLERRLRGAPPRLD